MVQDAQKYAAEDKKIKELAEARNQADALVYSTEKTLRELGDKVDSAAKERIEGAIGKLKEAVAGSDLQKIKDASEQLSGLLHEISTKLYEQTRQAGQSGTGEGPHAQKSKAGSAQSGQQEDVVDADYEVVDEEEKK